MADSCKPRIDLNPSSADRWTDCTASPKFIFDNWDKLPEQDRKFADEGTTAHEVAAALLQGRKINPQACPVPIKPEMNWHAWEYTEFIDELRERGGRIIVEQKLPLFYAKGRNAIVDAAVINPNNLHIVDYKYGEGIIVSPENNLQAIIYAKSVVWSGKTFTPPDDFPVSITIYQPRTRDEVPYHTWQTTWGEIASVSARLQRIAVKIGIESPDLVFAPSEKACQWCPAKGFCQARQQELLKDLSMLATIDDSPKPDGRVLTTVQLAAIVEHGDHIIKWIKDAKAYALRFMKGGGVIPRHKLVLSRGGNRYWSNPELAAKYLLEDTILEEKEVYERKVIGPAGVEELIGKGKFPKRVYNLIAKPPGQPVIAPEDDPRPSALVDGAKEFADLDSGNYNLEDF